MSHHWEEAVSGFDGAIIHRLYIDGEPALGHVVDAGGRGAVFSSYYLRSNRTEVGITERMSFDSLEEAKAWLLVSYRTDG